VLALKRIFQIAGVPNEPVSRPCSVLGRSFPSSRIFAVMPVFTVKCVLAGCSSALRAQSDKSGFSGYKAYTASIISTTAAF
jgi:hypothetical protein